jgi:TatD DNase family protein
MIDTHCHLTDKRLLEQGVRIFFRAAAAGVERMLTIGTHPKDWPGVLKIVAAHANVRCAIGIHPNHTHEYEPAAMDELRTLAGQPNVLAIGEMGVDYHYDFSPKERQRKFFEAQLQIATDLSKPVVIHCREAVTDCLEIMKNFPKISADFHCFTGTAEEARQILSRGYYLGFTGAVTFKKNDELREIAAFAPADRIFVETDAPYLTPEPMRKQKTNEPALVVHVGAAVAAARKISIAELDRITTENAERFFNWRN